MERVAGKILSHLKNEYSAASIRIKIDRTGSGFYVSPKKAVLPSKEIAKSETEQNTDNRYNLLHRRISEST